MVEMAEVPAAVRSRQVAVDLRFVEGDYATLIVVNLGATLLDVGLTVMESGAEPLVARTITKQIWHSGEAVEFDLPMMSEWEADAVKVDVDGVFMDGGVYADSIAFARIHDYFGAVREAGIVMWPRGSEKVVAAIDELRRDMQRFLRDHADAQARTIRMTMPPKLWRGPTPPLHVRVGRWLSKALRGDETWRDLRDRRRRMRESSFEPPTPEKPAEPTYS